MPEQDATKAGRGRHSAASRFANNKLWLIIIGAVVVCLAGAGVALAMTSGSKKAAAPPAPVDSSTTTTAPPPVCPLTGAPAPSGTVPARPAIGVKVDNYPAARPWTGVDKADIVFEEPVEGKINRLVAVFQCQTPDLVGDIRSARAPDVPISDLLSHPLFVHAGGINPIIAQLQSADLTDVNLFSHGSLIQHPPGRSAPYDTYTSPAAVWALYPNATTAPAPVFTYSPAPVGGTPASSAHIPYSSTNDNVWTWNATSNAWTLAIGGEPATVQSGAPVTPANVVIMTVGVTYGPWAENDMGGLEVQAQMTGSGAVTVLRNGQQIGGNWNRASLTSPMTLNATGGAVIPLAPGATWVEIVPNYVSVSVTP